MPTVLSAHLDAPGYITWTRTDETLVSYYVIYWTELPNMTDEASKIAV